MKTDSNSPYTQGIAHIANVSRDALLDEMLANSKQAEEFAAYLESLDACEVEEWMAEKRIEFNSRAIYCINVLLEKWPSDEYQEQYESARKGLIQNLAYFKILLMRMQEEGQA